MTNQTFDIRIDANYRPGTVEIEIYPVGVDASGGRVTDTSRSLAVKKVRDRGDIPGDGDQWFDTGSPEQMAEFAALPDWLRNDALTTLAEAFVFLDENPSGYDTHTKNA